MIMSDQTSDPKNIPLKEDYLPFLDGLRGMAALWVIASHSLYLAGSDFKYFNRGDIAVDLFMIMSGFLMTYHYYAREGKEPWEKPRTWLKFYVRRFFRIAPLYYVLLAVFFLLGPMIAHCREGIVPYFPDTATDSVRFLDRSLQNIAMHVSFLFGLSKTYVVRTVMPDWSISVEMQFYWAFPFLMLVFRRYYFVIATVVLYAVSYKMNAFLYHDGYQKPSLLPMSLIFFMMGMLLALFNCYRADRLKAACALGLAFWLASLTQERFIIAIVLLITLLLTPNSIGKPVKCVAKVLGSRFSTWLADMSYSAYLLHMGIMMPLAYLCSQWETYRHMPGPLRSLMLFVLTVICTYSLAMILFHTIEKNGILWGKRVIERL
jgi:peptidoglycan/LPS O-acetylase OafA/YrhL